MLMAVVLYPPGKVVRLDEDTSIESFGIYRR